MLLIYVDVQSLNFLFPKLLFIYFLPVNDSSDNSTKANTPKTVLNILSIKIVCKIQIKSPYVHMFNLNLSPRHDEAFSRH